MYIYLQNLFEQKKINPFPEVFPKEDVFAAYISGVKPLNSYETTLIKMKEIQNIFT